MTRTTFALAAILLLHGCNSSASQKATQPTANVPDEHRGDWMQGTEEISQGEKPALILKGLIDLIESSRSIADFSPERLAAHLHTPVGHSDEDHYGSLEEISDQWSLAFAVDLASDDGPRFELYFQDNPLNSYPPMTQVCEFDFDEFSSSLETMGFSRYTYDGLHSSLGWDRFSDQRPGGRNIAIEIYPLGEGHEPVDLIGHHCIKRIVIQ